MKKNASFVFWNKKDPFEDIRQELLTLYRGNNRYVEDLIDDAKEQARGDDGLALKILEKRLGRSDDDWEGEAKFTGNLR